MNILAIIPARMGSSRFPGKPMALILGKPMIGHVYERVNLSCILTHTVVATCDKEISEYIKSIGGKAIMTSEKHERASDRCAEALIKIEKEYKIKYDIVVMVQGDEPMTHPDMINEAVKPMIENKDIEVVNLKGDIEDMEEFNDPNCIKVVCDNQGDALYFSRQPIPNNKLLKPKNFKKQVCIIPFRREFLIEYTKLSPTFLEVNESIDMLRVLEHGKKVRMVPTKFKSFAVDTKEDLIKVEKIINSKK